jgi:hypothetical protein
MAIYNREGQLLLGSPEEREFARRRWAELEAARGPEVAVMAPEESQWLAEQGRLEPAREAPPPDPRLTGLDLGSPGSRAAARQAAGAQGYFRPPEEEDPLAGRPSVRPSAEPEAAPEDETPTARIQRTGVRSRADIAHLLSLGPNMPLRTLDDYPIQTPAAELDLLRQRDAERRAERAATANPLVSTGLRVGPALIGGAVGTLVPGGTYAGGAAGAAIGSELARRYEGRELIPAELASDVAWGLVPGGSVARVPTTAGKIAARALLGGAMGVGQAQTTKLARGEGWVTPEEAALSGGLGALGGAAVEGVVQGRRVAAERALAQPPRTQLQDDIADAFIRTAGTEFEAPPVARAAAQPVPETASSPPSAWESALTSQAGRVVAPLLTAAAGGGVGAVTGYALPAESDEERWTRAANLGVLGASIGAGLAPRGRVQAAPAQLPKDLKAALEAVVHLPPGAPPPPTGAPPSLTELSPASQQAVKSALAVPGTTVSVTPGGKAGVTPGGKGKGPPPLPVPTSAPPQRWSSAAELDAYAQEILAAHDPYAATKTQVLTPTALNEAAARGELDLAASGLSLEDIQGAAKMTERIAGALAISTDPADQALAYDVLHSARTGGQSLNVLSQWSKRMVAQLNSADPAEAHQARINIAAVETYNLAKAAAHEQEKWSGWAVPKGIFTREPGAWTAGYNKVRSNMLGLAVSRLSTTAWNVLSQGGRSGIHLADLVARGVFDGKPFRGFGDALEYGQSMWNAFKPDQRQRMAQYLALFPHVGRKLNIQASTETQGDLMRLTRWVNKPNGLQENYFKTAGFMAELPRVLREEGYDPGTMLQYPGAIPEHVMNKVANNTLELVFAKPFESGAANSFLNLYRNPVSGIPASMVARYPRYQGNALKFAANFSPLGLFRPLFQKASSPAERTKWLAQGAVGSLLWTSGLAAQQMFRGDTWHELKIPGVEQPIDFLKLGPEAVATLYVGEKLRQLVRQARGLPPDRQMTDIDDLQGITAGNRMGGAGMAMVRWLTGADPGTGPEVAGKMLGELIAMPTVPAEQIADLIDTGKWLWDDAGEGLEEGGGPPLQESQIIRSSRGEGFLENVYLPAQQHIPGLREYLPEAPDPLGAAPLHHPSPPGKLVGWSGVETTPLKSLAKRLGMEPEELYPRTGDPDADRAWAAAQGRAMEKAAPRLLSNKKFGALPLGQQRLVFKDFLQEMRAMVKPEAIAEEPKAFLRQEMLRDPKIVWEAAGANLSPAEYVDAKIMGRLEQRLTPRKRAR